MANATLAAGLEHGPMTRRRLRRASLSGLLLLATAAPMVLAGPPANKTYFVLKTGLEGPYAVEADCLTFTQTEVCTYKSRCGDWWETEPGSRERGFAFELTFADNDVPFQVDGQARVDDRGRRDSAAGVARLSTPGAALNWGFSGRSTSRRKCLRLLRDFRNSSLARNPACVQEAVFVSPVETEYVLPFPVGASSTVSQSYCYINDSHSDSYAYDFRMPMGSEIAAARSGTVQFVSESFPDDPEAARSNGLAILHDDGTEALYGHLQENGVTVEAGDRVQAGDLIGYSGNSSTGGFPHLHFEVRRAQETVPVSFRNVDGPLDERGGLRFGYSYTAAPY